MKYGFLRYEDFGNETGWEAACKVLQEAMGYDMSLSNPGFHHWKFAVGKVDLMGCDAWIVVAQDANLKIEKGEVLERKPRNYGDVYVYVATPDGWHGGNGFQLRNSSSARSSLDIWKELEGAYTGDNAEELTRRFAQAEADAFNAWFAEQVELLSAQVSEKGEAT